MRNALVVSWLALLAIPGGIGEPAGTQVPGVLRGESITVSPGVLTLPTGGFHYDPLIRMYDARGAEVWTDLTSEVHAVSSNPQVATVDERVRIKTTGASGTAEISITCLANPKVQATVKVTTVQATIDQVRLAGPTSFDMYVGQTLPVEATAVLSTGDVIPHAHYSSDLDVVFGSEFAGIVDGVGLSALKASPPDTPIKIGFFRGGGGTAEGTISVREPKLSEVKVLLGGKEEGVAHNFLLPSGCNAVLEVVGVFEGGQRRPLRVKDEYSVTLSGDEGFAFTSPGTVNGFLAQPVANRTVIARIDLRDDLERRMSRSGGEIEVRVTSVDGAMVTGLRGGFQNYSDDHRLLSTNAGYARELRVLADFPGLSGFRVSGWESLSLSDAGGPLTGLGLSRAGWPTLSPTGIGAAGDVQLRWGAGEATLPMVSVVTPHTLTVTAEGRRAAEQVLIELGQHLCFRTMVDYGDGHGFVSRTSDYPVTEAGQTAFLDPGKDATRFFLNVPSALRPAGRSAFLASDAEGRALRAVGSGSQSVVQVEVVRQSDPEFRLDGLWKGPFPASEGDEGIEIDFHAVSAFFVREGRQLARQCLEVERNGANVRLTLTSEKDPRSVAVFTGSLVDRSTMVGRYVNTFLDEDFDLTLIRL